MENTSVIRVGVAVVAPKMKLSLITTLVVLTSCAYGIGPEPTSDAGNNTILFASAGNGCITQTQSAPGCQPVFVDHGSYLQPAFFCCPVDAGSE